jgi:hypothetical protein
METIYCNLPTPTTARVYVNLPEGKLPAATKKGDASPRSACCVLLDIFDGTPILWYSNMASENPL